MNELMNRNGSRNHRWQLLATASAFALLAAVVTEARAEEKSRPTVWIELGGQLQRVDGREDAFAPDFTQLSAAPYSPISPTQAQRPPRYSIGGEGKITFAPSGSDWVFAAELRYGRSNRNRLTHQQTNVTTTATIPLLTYPLTGRGARFADTDVKNRGSQLILDFKAGKDVGLGMFGQGSESTFSLGVRIAQINSKSQADLHARPDYVFGQYQLRLPPPLDFVLPLNFQHHDYIAKATAERSFHGVGPSASWEGSIPLMHDREDTTINFDWGVSGAVLFGRQKAQGGHYTKGYFYEKKYHLYSVPGLVQTYSNPTRTHNRSRSVIVPNIGGYVGVSYRFPNVKVSLGYRGDFFFGAMDTGIDTRHTADRDYHGPYATVSVGL